MGGSGTGQDDAALDALTRLSEVTASSIDGLIEVNEQLESVRRHRGQGWTWHRILSVTNFRGSLSAVSAIAAGLGRAAAQLRRSLALVLRTEGVRITEIGRFFEVSRQRASALLRSRDTP
ncbi:MAG: hypothetical protein ABSG36_19100 [Acidimicrobiales bacterium]|jgi:hypothetical protein